MDAGKGACCMSPGQDCTKDCYNLDLDISYVDPVFALCDTHAWNAGYYNNDMLSKTEDKNTMNEVIGLKTTIITQQLYKQYTTLEQMIKQLKIMLEKEVLKASLQVAGGTTSVSNSGSSNSDNEDNNEKLGCEECAGLDPESALTCLRENYLKLKPFVEKNNIRNDVAEKIVADCKVLRDQRIGLGEQTTSIKWYKSVNVGECPTERQVKSQKKQALDPYMTGITRLQYLINQQKINENRTTLILGK